MKVITFTTANGQDDSFGSTCVFKTIRIGFPNAHIIVVDNHSDDFDSVREAIKGLDCDVVLNSVRLNHHDLIQKYLKASTEPTVFLDQDIIFYDDVQSDLKKMVCQMAGRFVPNYYNNVVKANEVARVHTSLLYFPNPQAILSKLDKFEGRDNYPLNPFAPFVFFNYGKPYFYDTCANLFHQIERSSIYLFGDKILDKYTHLVSGSMLNHVTSKLPEGERLKQIHELAKIKPSEVRYLWKEQEQFYSNNPHI